MATRMRGVPQQDLDIRQIIREAQVRWLRPLEVCEILRNYQKYNFKLNPVPPNRPTSGSLFLFDRKALRYFRKDGHNWRKKKDGKTVREAHERLKAGSIDVLHCYYAHGEDDPAFQRRSYWMLEGAYEHIVLVHYLDVQGLRPTAYRTPEQPTPQIMSPENVETGSSYTGEQDEAPDSGEEVEEIPPPVRPSGVQPSLMNQISLPKDWSSILSSVTNTGASSSSAQQYPTFDDDLDLEEFLGNPELLGSKPALSPAITLDTSGWNGLLQGFPKQEANPWQEMLEQSMQGSISTVKVEDDLETPKGIAEAFSPRGLGREPQSALEAQLRAATQENALKSAMYSANRRWQEPSRLSVQGGYQQMEAQSYEFQSFHSPLSKAPFQQQISPPAPTSDGLQKMDSFGRWFEQQVGEDSPVQAAATYSESGNYWFQDEATTAETPSVQAQMQLDVNVSISHVQRFTITDFSPDYCIANEETKVLISGRFLETVHNPLDYKWCCMFGDVEVPAEVINVGVLRCNVPPHAPGRIPFYVTCSDRLACSEVREFHIRPKKEVSGSEEFGGRNEKEMLVQVRLARLLLKEESETKEPSPMCSQEEWNSLETAIKEHTLTELEVKERLIDAFFKYKLQAWLASRTTVDAAKVRDEHGQGVLHMVAALGYDWAVKMVIEAGVVPDYRDGRGWAALHWAALFGREPAILKLLGLGASPVPVTDPTTKHPRGQTPSDIAASSGYKGIAGYLGEKFVTGMLSSLTIAEKNEVFSNMSAALAGESAVQNLSDGRTGDDHLSLQRSLSAVRNTTQAAALIHSAYRQDSFRKRNAVAEGEEGVDEYGMGLQDIQAIQMHHKGNPKAQSSAALQIQKKFRGWKNRKEFLNLRKQVVRIQAHVRGHQARKQFRKIIWMVGVVEKAVLRWRRKRVGLRGFRPEENPNGASSDDEDFLRESRKQKEQVLEKALTRVQSMARDEEARAQYRRMLEGSKKEEEASTSHQEGESMDDQMIT